MNVPLMQYTLNGVPHRIIRDEEDNVMLEISGYEVNINDLIRALHYDRNLYKQGGKDEDSN